MDRILAGLFLTTLALAGAADAAAPAVTDHLVLNELQPNPIGRDRGNEWVELYNPTPMDQPLDGWNLQDHRGRTHDLTGLVAPAFSYVTISLDGSLQLVNSGGRLQLMDAEGAAIDTVSYGQYTGSNGHAHAAPGEGESLARYFVHGEGRFATFGGNAEWYVESAPTPGASNFRVEEAA